ncbi:MAG: transcription antitermination factor NusB [Candidatus Eisenbacteria sp.]|nr:transcription antitermination factor NusB [Candidatus Eisenbacteria bacterium]
MRSRRRRAREIAFQALYQSEHGQDSVDLALAQILEERKAGPDASEYARSLVEAFSEHRSEIDRVISQTLERWKMERLAAIDRSILRIATGELLYGTGVPGEVVIDEAVEIAKKYSTEQSGAFVNGILDRLWRTAGKGTVVEGGD